MLSASSISEHVVPDVQKSMGLDKSAVSLAYSKEHRLQRSRREDFDHIFRHAHFPLISLFFFLSSVIIAIVEDVFYISSNS